jgi:hypothetical protein
VAPDDFDSFIDDHLLHVHSPPNNQTTFIRAAPDSGANDFGICSVDDAIAAVEIANYGISSDHFSVLFHLFSSATNSEPEQERKVWNREGNAPLFRQLLKASIISLSSSLQSITAK